MQLTHGTKTLTEYMHAFNNLSRYAPGFVDTKEKKIESFKRGLGTKLMKTMANSRCTTYNEFISDALTQENHNNLHAATKGRKRAAKVGASGSSQSRAPVVARPQFQPPAPSSGILHQKLRPIDHRRCFVRRSPLPYPRGMEGKEAQQDPRAINPASTVIKWVIGPRNAPTLRRTTIRTRTIRDRQILKHILDTCTTLLLKRFP
jgi:hypothetical protein